MKMTKQRGSTSQVGVLWAAISTILMCFLLGTFSAARCYFKWEDSGYESKWRPFAGCRVKLSNGQWIPADAVRDIK